jgi:co-chaperonin GroES (HSP10)
MITSEIESSKVSPISDHVLVLPDADNDHIHTKSGMKFWIDTSFEPDKHATVRGTVLKAPQKLSSGFKTGVEVSEGDVVFFSYMAHQEAKNEAKTIQMIVEGEKKECMLIHYELLFLAQDGRSDQEQGIRPLNGYLLVEGLRMPQEQKIGSIYLPESSTEKYHRDYGRILHPGTPPKGEMQEFESGQTVMLAVNADIPLENELHQKLFPGRRVYRVDRGSVEGVVEDMRVTEAIKLEA